MDLIRGILRGIEYLADGVKPVKMEMQGVDKRKLQYHLELLYEAKYIKAIPIESKDSNEYYPTGLTWQGHDFLDAARDDTMWQKAKDIVYKKTGTLTIDAVKIVLGELIKGAL